MRWVSGGLDVVGVLVFVAIGRAGHDEAGSLSGFLGTLWPFLVALGLGWALTRAWREAAETLAVGAGIWVTTVGGGMVLRAVSGQGTAVAFIVVATLFLGLVLLGWRVCMGLVRWRRAGAT